MLEQKYEYGFGEYEGADYGKFAGQASGERAESAELPEMKERPEMLEQKYEYGYGEYEGADYGKFAKQASNEMAERPEIPERADKPDMKKQQYNIGIGYGNQKSQGWGAQTQGWGAQTQGWGAQTTSQMPSMPEAPDMGFQNNMNGLKGFSQSFTGYQDD